MLRVNIEYYVKDQENKTFRSPDAIAKSIEREMRDNPRFFEEASYYQIVVRNETEHSVIEHQKEGEK